jgi:hypothetical protein
VHLVRATSGERIRGNPRYLAFMGELKSRWEAYRAAQ